MVFYLTFIKAYGIIEIRLFITLILEKGDWTMFKFLFIRRHRESVLDYIRMVYDDPKPSRRRYALPDDFSGDVSTTRFSDRDSDDSSEVKYSERGSSQDRFDPKLVRIAMRGFSFDSAPAEAPIKPLSSATNISFVQKLQHLIRQKGLVETQVYKAALMDRRLFSKIISNKDYKPSKDTALALIFALKLNMKEATDLLERAGYTLSHSIPRDIIIEYFISERIYNLNNINAFLYNMNEKIIGRSV